ncbi:MAG: YccF domain-containing protein [Corynebacterium sp.]|nr:YccF domain-containing protein [Corynebacterium sp.]
MRTLLNIIWLVTSGIWMALAYIFVGIIACLLIITIPFGIASFRMASYALWPFGRSLIEPVGGTGSASKLGNVIWFLVAGLWLCLGHIATAVVQAVTIIGLPLAWGNIKMLPVACFPLGRSIVRSDEIPFGYQPMVSL